MVALKGVYWWWWWWPVAVKQLRGHQWSMRTCPPWEAVSHFCCFILLLPLQNTENKETFVPHFAFFHGDAPPPPSSHPPDPPNPPARTGDQPSEFSLLHICQKQLVNHLLDEQLPLHAWTNSYFHHLHMSQRNVKQKIKNKRLCLFLHWKL